MDNNLTQEYMANAELALANSQFETALEWLRKAVEASPEDLYVLSRTGAVCVSQQLFDEALGYFRRARDLDPGNGDNQFNLGNAYFFHNEYAKAFDCFVEAERIGCSADVMMQLYYQMMIMTIMRQDLVTAKIYMQKMEDLDISGTIAMTPDFISEKLKLEMLCQDFDKAEKYAAQLVAIQPGVFRHYAVYYSLLMAHKKYETAQIILNQAGRYAKLSGEDEVALASQKAGLYLAMADQEPEQKKTYYQQAVDAMMPMLHKERSLDDQQRELVYMTLCDVLTKAERYDEAIELAEKLLGIMRQNLELPENPEGYRVSTVEVRLDEAEVNRAIQRDSAKMRAAGIEVNRAWPYKVNGNGERVPVFPEKLHDVLADNEERKELSEEQTEEFRIHDLSAESREKLYFTLTTCHLAKDNFAEAGKTASVLKNSENQYYSYYGRYVEALASRHDGTDAEKSRELYEKANAYFRSRMVANHTDTLAVIFRGRMYAECGKFALAEQMAGMLSEQDRNSLRSYMDQLRSEQ